MIPILIIGACVVFIIRASQPSFKDSVRGQSPTIIRGESIDLTPHLTEFTQLIRKGHRPNQWLVTEAISEAYHIGNWPLVRSIADNYTDNNISTIKRRKKVETPIVETEESEKEEISAPEQLSFQVEKTSSPIDGVNNDDWRMFVLASRAENPEFESDSSIGMFRQNKKRLVKLGIPDVKDPLKQYDAFEKEVSNLMVEGQELFKLSVAMPVEVDGENIPMTLSGLLAVMRNAGTVNASKWIDSPDERKRFPHTTEAFKRANGCF